MSLVEVKNMATGLQSFTLVRSGGMLPQEILVTLGLLRRILVHSEASFVPRGKRNTRPGYEANSEAYRKAHRAYTYNPSVDRFQYSARGTNTRSDPCWVGGLACNQ